MATRDEIAEDKLRQQTLDILWMADAALERSPRLVVPALILLYSLIDGMAWLYMPPDQEDVKQRDFEAWTEAFLVRPEELECSSADLYAARCGVLHSQAMDSRNARQGKARHICYTFGPDKLIAPLMEASNQEPVMLDLDQFRAAVRRGVDRFLTELKRDQSLKRRVLGRAARYFDELSIS